MHKITCLAIVFYVLLAGCISQQMHVYPTATPTNDPSITRTQLAKPVFTSTTDNIYRKTYVFIPNPTATTELRFRRTEEIAIYSAFLEVDCKSPAFVLEEASYGKYVDDEFILQEEPSLSTSTLEDYRRNNKTKLLDPEVLPEQGLCKFISSDEIESITDKGEGNFMIINFSTIGFNENFDQAIVYSGYYCGKLCAGGSIYLLVRNDDIWSIKQFIPLWVS